MQGIKSASVAIRRRLYYIILPPVILYPTGPGITPHSEVMITTSIAGVVAGFFRDRLGGGHRGG